MDMPQEIEVWYVIPALRRELVRAMVDKDMKQKDIAKYLDITESAVSQYLSGKRGKGIEFEKDMLDEIKKSVEIILSNPLNLMNEIQGLIRLTRQKKIICKMHLNTDKLPEKCEACLI
ncbi:transcriptional regulator [Nanoarchaeota archaeon]